ncbi:hypothetical protein V8C26DRAFT_182375 [Trichoderma gracile]
MSSHSPIPQPIPSLPITQPSAANPFLSLSVSSSFDPLVPPLDTLPISVQFHPESIHPDIHPRLFPFPAFHLVNPLSHPLPNPFPSLPFPSCLLLITSRFLSIFSPFPSFLPSILPSISLLQILRSPNARSSALLSSPVLAHPKSVPSMPSHSIPVQSLQFLHYTSQCLHPMSLPVLYPTQCDSRFPFQALRGLCHESHVCQRGPPCEARVSFWTASHEMLPKPYQAGLFDGMRPKRTLNPRRVIEAPSPVVQTFLQLFPCTCILRPGPISRFLRSIGAHSEFIPPLYVLLGSFAQAQKGRQQKTRSIKTMDRIHLYRLRLDRVALHYTQQQLQ